MCAVSHQVIARKWRPQNFSDVVGQKTITQTLQNAILAGRIGHAFIFSGARGVGKTTTARIFARALNCHKGPTPTPCNECPSCLDIAAGSSLDVLEIDAASNTGVDNIRELRETLQYRTARDHFKIYIIDEVHMLSNNAFNALLKTLEEPPEHVKFIMATTESHRIPATILSRCQQFEFKMIPSQQILDKLRQIVQAEGVEISEHALRMVCEAGEGSMRDAQSALEQVLAYSGKKVLDSDAEALLGVIDEESIGATLEAVAARDRKGVLQQVNKISDHGHNLQLFCRELAEYARHLLVLRIAGPQSELLSMSSSALERMQKLAPEFSEIDLLRIYDLLSRAESELRWHPSPHFHMEITLLKLVELRHLESIEHFLAGGAVPEPAAKRPALVAPAAEPPPRTEESVRAPLAPPEAGSKEEPVAEHLPVSSDPPAGDASPPSDPRVQVLLEAVHRDRPGLSAILEKARISAEGDRLHLTYSDKQRVTRGVAQEPANRAFLEKLWREIAGASAAIQFDVDTKTEPRESGRKDHRALSDPRVKLFTDAFPGKISIEDLDPS